MEKINKKYASRLSTLESVKLENCSLEQLDQLVSVSREAYIDNYRHIWTDSGENYLEKNFTKEVLEKDFSDDNLVYYFVRWRGEYIGFVKLHIHAPIQNYSATEALYLERLYLKKAFCGKGIGTRVMHLIFDMSENFSKHIIWLRAMPSTPTVRFYERMGFETIAKGKIPFPFIKPEHSPLYTISKNLQK